MGFYNKSLPQTKHLWGLSSVSADGMENWRGEGIQACLWAMILTRLAEVGKLALLVAALLRMATWTE